MLRKEGMFVPFGGNELPGRDHAFQSSKLEAQEKLQLANAKCAHVEGSIR